MTRTSDARTAARVQVYFENPKVEKALRREAAVGKMPLSRAAERAIERGLHKRPAADPEDRLLRLDRALRDHMRSTARDMTIVQELVVEVARALFLRLPDGPPDRDALVRAAADARVERMLDAAAARIAGGGSIRGDEDPHTAPPEAAARQISEARSFST